jgi:hypothetical protein
MVRVPCKLGMGSFSQTTNYLPFTGLLNMTISAVDLRFLITHVFCSELFRSVFTTTDCSGTLWCLILVHSGRHEVDDSLSIAREFLFFLIVAIFGGCEMSVVRASVPKMILDDVFEQKNEIANNVREELEKAMRTYGYEIVQTLIVDIEPDATVKHAMNEINAGTV